MATKTTQKKPVKKSKATTAVKKVRTTDIQLQSHRRMKIPKRKFYKRQDKRFRERSKLPSSFKLTKQAALLIRDHWKVIGGIMVIYGILNILLVQGLNGGLDVSNLKNQTDTLFGGATRHLASGFTIFALLLSSSNNVASAASSAYQTFLLIIVSLAVVWSYRQMLSGNKVRIRDGFYLGMYPLIPVILVLLVVCLELIPLLGGVWLYVAIIGSGIATTGLEQFGTAMICLLLASASIYLVCSSLFALYIATLPGMTPVKALRSARELIRYQRWSLIRKILFLPFALFCIGAVIMLPFIILVPVIAQWVFFVLSTFVLAAIHAYLYSLYRELIRE